MSLSDQTINFTRGVPADESFPLTQIAECANFVLGGAYGPKIMQYGPSHGFMPLREWLAVHHNVQPEHVLVGNGSLQLLDFLGHALIERGDRVLTESPTYDRTLTLLRRHGAKVEGVNLEADGPDLAGLERTLHNGVPKLLYVIPDFQNPSGATMALHKRQRIAELAEQHDFWLIEDAPYRPLRYRGHDLPTLLELAPTRTLHMSSFTKQIGPGVRVGYMIGEPKLLDRIARVAEDTYITPNLVGQAMVYEFCQRDLLNPQLERLRRLYGERLSAIATAIREQLPTAKWIEPEGGFFLSLALPSGTSSAELRQRAADVRMNLSDGRGFFPNPADGEHFLRLPFCALTPDQISEGIRRLAMIV